MRQITLGLILILSSLSAWSSEAYWESFKLRWMSVERIQFTDYVKFSEPIRSPAGATILLATAVVLNKSFSYEKDCLIYTVPSKNLEGILKLVNISYDQQCEDHILSKKYEYEFSKIYNLVINLEKRELNITADIKNHKFNLTNMILKKRPKLLDTSASRGRFVGAKISFIEESSDSSLKAGDICFDVDSKCSVIKDECFRCQQGLYPAIASSCTQKVRRYCGTVECGTKGNPACIRGYKATGYTGPYCINDSPIAYCKSPLRVICINNELVCR